MKKLKTFLVVILSIAMVLSAGCTTPGGLTLTSLVLDATSVDTQYVLGDTYDFSGIKLTAKYNDASENKTVGYDDVKMTYDTEFNTKLGTHTITFKYTDSDIGQSQETTFEVSVVSSSGGTTPAETMDVAEFIKPAAVTKCLELANEDRKAYGQAGYEAQLAKKNPDYKVGDDNAFKFVTKLWVYDYDLQDTVEETGFAIEAKIYQDDILLVAGEVSADNKVEYTRPSETDVLVTVDVVRQEYQFASNLVGQKFKIQVTPDTDVYLMDTPIVQEITVNVVDGYNVYDPIQLAVIDNTDVLYTTHKNATAWASIKSANGLTGVNPKAIILQNDLQIKAEHMPESFLGTLQEDFYYYDTVIAEDTTTYTRLEATPAGTKYIRDGEFLYYRVIAETDTFTVEGNSFSMDFSQAPLAPSSEVAPKVRDNDGNVMDDFGSDFSNVSIFYVDAPRENDQVGGNFNVKNLDLTGNAERSQVVDKEGGDLRGSGGTVLLKTRETTANYYNVTMCKVFIGVITEERVGCANMDYVKGFDFFQNALYAWGGQINVSNSTFERCGGPVAIIQHTHYGTDDWIPTLNIVNSTLKSELSGQEFWFSTLGANQMAGQIALLSQILTLNGMGSYTNSASKMNLVALIMEGEADISVVANYGVEGKVTIADSEDDTTPFVLSRMYSDATDVIAQYTKAIQGGLEGGLIVPLFSVNEKFAFLHDQNNAGLTMVVTGNDQLPNDQLPEIKYDQLPKIKFNPSSELTGSSAEDVKELKDAFKATDYYGLNYGGFGIVLGGYNA